MNSPAPVRVRFAPSPTGFLHVGGVRTALFNWLYAKHHGGKFLIRIEDTDLERSEARFTQDILNALRWLGLSPDADEPLLYQSQRADRYRELADKLVSEGKAYRCYCTPEEVDEMRKTAQSLGKKPRYDRRCRDLNAPPAGKSAYVIRVKCPIDGEVVFEDLIHGEMRVSNEELDDFIIVRSTAGGASGAPMYNFTVVVDDVETRMTHIIRGDDHLNNTPKQIHLYQALGFPIPKFAHLPMILGPDKKKLSKRHGAVSTEVFKNEGYLPETLLNFLVRLGWSHGDQEIFSVDEMIRFFDFDHVQKSAAVFNYEKLLWMNGQYIKESDPKRLAELVVSDFGAQFAGEAADRARSEFGLHLVKLIQPKVKLLKELADQLAPFCHDQVLTDLNTQGLKWNKKPETKKPIQEGIQAVVLEWAAKAAPLGGNQSLKEVGLTHLEIEARLKGESEKQGVKLGEMMEPMRLALTGAMASVGVFDLLEVLPWRAVESRLKQVQTW